MQWKRSFSLGAIVAVAALAAGRPPVATFSQADAARAFGTGCGVAPKGKIRLHRDSSGSRLTLVAEKQSEAVFFPQQQSCNQIQDDVLDIWRKDDGTVAAQLIARSDGHRLLIDDHAELRGKRFDVERTGQYLVISLGNTSTLSAVARPYLKLGEVDLDAQRLFSRKGTLFVVGDNPATGLLEGRTVRITPSGLVADPNPIALAGMPAGVRVLDYAEDSDDLLLSGIDASGQASFVVVNVATGRATPISPLKPGDDMALFIRDNTVRARLTGVAGPASPTQEPHPRERRGWFRF